MSNNIKTKEWQEFVERGMVITEKEELKLFYDALLTPAEREEIPKRFHILEELFKGELPQHKIASKLNVSIANVTRGVNAIRASEYDLKGIFDRINKESLQKKK
jgi:Trp operon repressor